MEKTTHSSFSKLMSFAFIAMGIFLGIYAFFANATTWTVGTINWDNANYLSGSFRDENPTDYDIITALYGTGDEGSVYTQNWTGYNSGSCLSGGMTVVYVPEGTSTIPLLLEDNTIYVLTGNEYITTGIIEFGMCTSLVSTSGAILYSTGQITAILHSNNKEFLIIDNIETHGMNNGIGGTHARNPNGIRLYDTHNSTIHSSEFSYNGTNPGIACGIHMTNSNYNHIINVSGHHDEDYGLSLINSHYNLIENSSFYNNFMDGIILSSSTYNTLRNLELYENGNSSRAGLLLTGSDYNILENVLLYENTRGLFFQNSSNNLLTGIYSSGNSSDGIRFSQSHNNSGYNITTRNNAFGINIYSSTHNYLYNIHSYDNTHAGLQTSTSSGNYFEHIFSYYNNTFGIQINTGNNNSFTDIESYDNTKHNLSINNSDNNTFIDITANGSTTAMGVYLSNSSNNNFMGLYTYGNYYAGVHFYNSYNNTGTAIVSNSNEGGLYMENSTGNVFENATIENNTKNGVMFVSGSNDNILSGAIVSGNMNHGIYMSNSNDNTLYGVTSNNSYRIGLLIETGNNNIVDFSTFNNNGLGIYSDGLYLDHNSGTIISNTTISGNKNTGIRIEYGNNNEILQSNIENNTRQGIHILGSHTNTISGCTLSGGTNLSIEIINSNNNNITNSTGDLGLDIMNSTGTNITMTSIYSIWEQNDLGLFLYTTYDPYTINNNNISIVSYDSNIAYITGITLPIGSIFDTYFDFLYMQTNLFPNPNNEITIYPDGLTISGSAWDGNIYLPTPIIAGTKLAELSETGINNIVELIKTIEIISGDTYLTIMNEGVGFAKYVLDSGISGQYLKIFKSNDGNIWTENTISSGCILNEYSFCDFDFVGDFKLFAFGVPSGSFTGITETGAIVTSGGVYNTGITITFENPNLSGATLNGVAYASGDVISGDDTYVFIMEDIFGNTTGMTFTIDTMGPICTGTTLGGDIIELMPSEILFGSMFLGFDTLNELERDRIFNTGLTLDYYDENLSGAMIANIADQDFTGEVLGDGDYIEDAGFYIIMLDDTLGNQSSYIFVIDYEDPTIDLEYPTDGLIINDNNNITFAFTGSDDTMIVGYTLYITGSQIYSGDVEEIDDNEEFMIHTVPLVNGDYTWHVIATDIAGNTGISDSNSFTIKSPLTGDAILSGSNVQYITGQGWYTKDYANISMRANDPINYTITGSDFSLATGNFIGSQIHNILLIGTDGRKDVFVTMTNSSGEYISKSFTLYLDTQAPVPMLITPASGATITTPLTLTWNAGPDNAGLSGYRYYVSTTNTFGTTIASGTTITPSVTLQSTQFSGPGTYYWYVVFVDKLGNLESSEVQTFIYSGSSVDTTPNSFTFTDIDDALRNRTYLSNTITITGMTANVPVLASINKGALYISGVFVGSTGYVQNGWTVNVELISSIEYEETVSSTLTINGVSDTFSVTTEEDDGTDEYDDIETTLSNTEKLMIIAIFETLRDVYAGDKEVEFFNTFMVMLENKIDEYETNDPEYESLTYLYNLIQEYYDGEFSGDTIDGTRWIVNGIYTAPNGKKYPITYDSSKQRFTSSNFVVPKYFPTLDTLKYIIDINNPVGSKYTNSKSILARWKNASIDGTRQSSPYTAPNKKTFYFFKTITGRYSSYTFTSERYFDSLDATKEFIYNSNK